MKQKKATYALAAAMTLGSIITLSEPSSAADLLVPGTYGYPDAYQYTCFSSNGSSLVLSANCPNTADRYWLYPVLRHAQSSQPFSTKVSWTASTLGGLSNDGFACGRVFTFNADGTGGAFTPEQCTTGNVAFSNKSISYNVTSGGQVILVMRMHAPTGAGLGTVGISRIWSDGF